MSFGSHTPANENAPGAVVCPLRRSLGWAVFWRRRRPGRAPRPWVRAASWGAGGVAAVYALACLKCITLYIVVPSVLAWCGRGVAAGSGEEQAAGPSTVSGAVSESVGSGGAAVGGAESVGTEAAR